MGRTLVTLALLLVGGLVLAPVGTMVAESFLVDSVVTVQGRVYRGHIVDRDDEGVDIQIPQSITTKHVPRAEVAHVGKALSIQHYERALTGPGQSKMFVATMALAGASTLLALLIGLPLGILFGATDLPGRNAFELFSILPLVLPPVLLAIATYHDLLGVKPAFLRAVIVFGLSLFPLVSLLTARAIRSVGGDALDAARLQTNPRDALFRVAVGPALPGAAMGALLVFAFTVADFAVPDFLGVTTAKNTITVYANAVFRFWDKDGNVGAATAAGMPPTLLAVLAFAAVLLVERKREAATLGSEYREPTPLPLGRAKAPALCMVVLVLGASLLWPAARHLETAAGANFGAPVAAAGLTGRIVEESRKRPASLLDGLHKGLQMDRVGESTENSLLLGGGGAVLAILLALILTEAGRGHPLLDRFLLIAAFLPVAVPPMTLAVGWATLFGRLTSLRAFPILLMGARLLPFATFAVRAARTRIAPELEDAAAVAGLAPSRRALRVVFPLVLPGVGLGFLLALLFGLREVDAILFTETGAHTLPVQLYNMIHYGFDVQVGALSFLWTAGLALLLGMVRILAGKSFRVLP